MLRLGVGWSCSGCGGTEYAGLWEVDKETQDAIEANEDFLSQIRQTLNEIEMEQTMTEKPTTQIPLSRRVMPSIIAHDIKGVSPMIGPIETKSMITERQGEGQVDVDVNPETGRRTWKIDVGSLSAERAGEVVDDVLQRRKKLID